MPNRAKPTAEHVQKFTAYVANWCDVLSLGDWRIAVSEKITNRKVEAEVYRFDLEQRLASVRLGSDWGGLTDKCLNETALHEVLHIFLHEMIEIAKKDADDDSLASAEHRVINVLERLLADR